MDMALILSITSSALRLTTPLLFAAIGVLITSKAGIVNMGMEGNVLFGAFVAVYVTYVTNDPMMGQMAAILCGLVYGAVQAFFILVCKANHTVSGLGLNFVAQGATTVLMGAVWNTSGSSPVVTKLPSISLGVFGNQSINLFICIALCFATWFGLQKTNAGLRLRSVGENPAASDSVGVDVFKYQFAAILIAGAFGGLAGAELTLGQIGAFTKLMTASKGFLAYSAVIFGGYSVMGSSIATFVLGFLDAFQMRAQLLVDIPGQALLALPYLFTLIALIGVGNVRKPAATGKIYQRGRY